MAAVDVLRSIQSLQQRPAVGSSPASIFDPIVGRSPFLIVVLWLLAADPVAFCGPAGAGRPGG